MFDQRPLHRSFAAVNINALSILPRCIKKAADDASVNIGVLKFDVSRFDSEWASVLADKFLADRATAEATHILRWFTNQAGDRTHTVGGIPHRGKAGPVV